MRFSFASATVVALAAQTVAGDWLGKSVYNKWHETELERWLSDHDIPYPTPYDRKNLEDLVKDNWEDNIASPYRKWDVNQLTNYITSSGKQVKKGTEKNVDSLIEQAQGYWHQTSKQATDTYGDVQSWIFNTWTESELKAFLDYHHIPNPTPRTRDSLLQTARSNYQTIATKIGESVNYPGDWLYQSWSDSELKAWLDERGIPVPQTGSRDKLIASLRRNSKLASDRAAAEYEKLSASAKDTQQYLSDQILDSWTDSEIKAWCDRNGIKVPQGSKSNELKALARKHAASLSGNNVKSSASSAYGAATSSAGNFYPQITDEVYAQARYWYDLAANQLGFAGEEVKSSFSSVSSVASVEASKLSVAASKSASSASVAASKKGENAAAAAASAAAEATKSAKASASSASVRARASSASARARASATSLKNEL
ncbi:stress response protein ish1 [Acrodontium crateriforme]|uniref:Stress response protein ish1 n=1 Tax=Acrodontium crateriforme TaxID=150365 RepID=A0AAQ3M450_9PEZI|nr:stress response protein ish1 [Acrodontium crateriforme]